MSDPSHPHHLEDFEERLKAAKAKVVPPPSQVATSALGRGLRYAMEIVVGTAVGGVIGWWLDGWLGTRPWLAILFLLLGLVAGFMNLMRAVNREAAEIEAEEARANEQHAPDGQNDRPGQRQN